MAEFLPDPPALQIPGESLSMGLFISVPVSAVGGSASFSITQPIIDAKVFGAAIVGVGAQVFLLIAQHLFKLESIPVIDVPKNKLIQMPIAELQEFLRIVSLQAKTPANKNEVTADIGVPARTAEIPHAVPGIRGFITPLPPEAPLTLSLYFRADYSSREFAPVVFFLIPILSFPGLTGSLPIIILYLLITIFVRAVVRPEFTGAKPHPKADQQDNKPLELTPQDLLNLLKRYGKHFTQGDFSK